MADVLVTGALLIGGATIAFLAVGYVERAIAEFFAGLGG